MRDFIASIFMAITVVAAFLLIIFGGYMVYSILAPRYEQVRYDTFKQSQTYNDGMLRDLENLRMEYVKANDEQKSALRAIILHRFSVYDEARLPYDLRVFYSNLKMGQ